MLFATALSGLAIGLSAPTTAEARADGPDAYRVVGLSGAHTLPVYVRPRSHARIVDHLEFNAVGIAHNGRYRRGFVKVRTAYGAGWVNTRHLAEDTGPVTYRVVLDGSYRHLNIRRRASARSRIIGRIPDGVGGVLHCGACEGNWCPVRFDGVDGWVHRNYIAVEIDPIHHRRDHRGSYAGETAGRYDRTPVERDFDDEFRVEDWDDQDRQYVARDNGYGVSQRNVRPRRTWRERIRRFWSRY